MTSDREQALALLEAFADHWKALDGEAVAACLEDSPTTTVIGTDLGEYIVGRDAYAARWLRGAYPTSAAAFDWTDEPVLVLDQNIAWAHGVVKFDLQLQDGRRAYGQLWLTAVLRRTDRWRIAHLHASYAEPLTLSG